MAERRKPTDELGVTETDTGSDRGREDLGSADTSPGAEPGEGPPGERDRIGRYRVVGRIGAGGMGVVYEAHDDQLDRRVAVKLLRGSGSGGGERLLAEARALAKLSHPNVVTVHEVDTHEDAVYVAMEYVEGRSLRRFVEEEADWRARLEVFRQAGEGLRAAHAAGIVHRDFKPENAIVGDDGRVRVLDFGLAKAAAEEAGDRETLGASGPVGGLTQTGAVLGTPRYMAPEQWQGGSVDERTDQFAFCVALYEALFDQRPFPGESLEDLGRAVCEGRLRPPPEESPVPAHVREAVTRGLAIEPGERHRDLSALLGALSVDRERPRRGGLALVAGALVVAAAVAIAFGWSAGDPAGGGSAEKAPDPEGPHADLLEASDLPPLLEEPLEGDPMEVTVHRLSNGLTVYVSPNRTEPKIEARIVFRVGARDDPPGATGVTHMLEHMLFKGTRRLGTVDHEAEAPHLEQIRELYRDLAQAEAPQRREEILADIDEATVAASKHAVPNDHLRTLKAIGVQANGRTSVESAVFNASIPSNRLESWAKLEADRFQNPVFRLYYPEVGAVVEEMRRMRPRARVWSAFRRGLFEGHRYGRSTIGTPEDVAAQPFHEMKRHFETWFVPNNAAVVLAGDVQPSDLAVLEAWFVEEQGWEPRELPERELRPLGELASARTESVRSQGGRHVGIAWRTVPAGHEDEAALDTLAWLLRESRAGSAADLRAGADIRSLGAYHQTLREGGAFYLFATLREEQSYEEGIAELDRLLGSIRGGALGKEEVEALSLHRRLYRLEARRDSATRAERMAQSFLRRESWSETRARLERSLSAGGEDVVRVAERYLGADRLVVEAGPEFGDDLEIERPPISRLHLDPGRMSELGRELREEDVVPLQPRFVTGADYEVKTSAHGAVIAAPDPETELFWLTLAYPFGHRQAPGICAALRAAREAGVGTRSAAERRKRRYRRGIRFEPSCHADWIELHLFGPDAALEEGIEGLVAWLGDPVWTDEAWARWGELLAEDLRRRPEDGQRLRHALFELAVHGAESGLRTEPSVAEVRSMSRQEVREALELLLSARRRTRYAGPRDPDELTQILERDLPPPVSGPEAAPPDVLQPERPRIVVLPWSGASAARAEVFFPIERITERKALVELTRSYLDQRMNQSLREQRGMTYSAYARIDENEPLPPRGLRLALWTGASSVAEAVRYALEEVRSAKPTRGAIAQAKASVDEAYRTQWLEPRQVPGAVDRWRRRGLEGDPRRDRFLRLQDLGRPEVEELLAELGEAPVIVCVFGVLEGADLQALRELGDVTELEPGDLFR